jgi:hypothetical protein
MSTAKFLTINFNEHEFKVIKDKHLNRLCNMTL